ncbi:MAG: TAXI family TRAP transporter solute-binding subunit [Hyphomicrobiales bacterium]
MHGVIHPSRRALLAAGGATAALSLLPSMPVLAGTPRVTLATATPGGGFQLFGKALIDAIVESGAGLTVEERPTGGSRENLKLLRGSAVDFAQVEGNAARQAFEEEDGKPLAARLKIAAAMYPGPGLCVMRADSPARSLDDLKGKRVIYGTHSSGLTILTRRILSGLGYDPDKDFEPVYLDKAGDGPVMVLKGKADALCGGGFGWPGFVKVAGSPGGARFLSAGAQGSARIRERFPFLREMTVPAGSYEGQDNDLVTVGLWSFILTRPDLPDDAARRFAEAAHKASPLLAGKLEQGAYATPQNTARNAPAELLHPGARAYLQEIGAF